MDPWLAQTVHIHWYDVYTTDTGQGAKALHTCRQSQLAYMPNTTTQQTVCWQSRQCAGRADSVLAEQTVCWQSRQCAGRADSVLAEQTVCWQSRQCAGRADSVLAEQTVCWQSRQCAGRADSVLAEHTGHRGDVSISNSGMHSIAL